METIEARDERRELATVADQAPVKTADRFEVLIMSEAGKLIYTYSNREDATDLMPLCTALINYAQKAQNETLNSMKTSDNLVINFTTRSPLIIVVIHEEHSFVDPLVLVEQVEAQVVSILTAKALRAVFEERPTFDLKRLLYGSEKLIDSILNLSMMATKLEWPWTQAFLAVTSSDASSQASTGGAPQNPTSLARPHRLLVPVGLMAASTRENLHNILASVVSSTSKNMVFTLVFGVSSLSSDKDSVDENETQDNRNADGDDDADEERASDMSFQLISVCNHHDRHKLKIADVHLILALLSGSRAQLVSVESLWIPVCLPRFNQDAFLHSFISLMNNSRNCLVMMSVDRDEFANCKKARDLIEEKFSNIYNDPSQKQRIHYQLSPLVHPTLLELQDKLTSNSVTADELAELQQQAQIYNSKFELYHARQLQFLWYQTSKQVLWWQRSASQSLSPVMFYVTKKMLQSSLKILWLKLRDGSTFLGWHNPTFQLYTQFDSTITTAEATEVIQKISNWIKREEDAFSIKDYR